MDVVADLWECLISIVILLFLHYYDEVFISGIGKHVDGPNERDIRLA